MGDFDNLINVKPQIITKEFIGDDVYPIPYRYKCYQCGEEWVTYGHCQECIQCGAKLPLSLEGYWDNSGCLDWGNLSSLVINDNPNGRYIAKSLVGKHIVYKTGIYFIEVNGDTVYFYNNEKHDTRIKIESDIWNVTVLANENLPFEMFKMAQCFGEYALIDNYCLGIQEKEKRINEIVKQHEKCVDKANVLCEYMKKIIMEAEYE